MRDSGKALIAYFYFDLRDFVNLCGLLSSYLSSSNFLLAPIPAVTYSPDSIPHTIVENRNQVIVQW